MDMTEIRKRQEETPEDIEVEKKVEEMRNIPVKGTIKREKELRISEKVIIKPDR